MSCASVEVARSPMMGCAQRIAAVLAAGVLIAFGGLVPAAGEDRVRVAGVDRGDHARLTLTWPEDLAGAFLDPVVSVEHGVVVIALPRAVDANVADLADALGPRVALARMDPDGRTLRLAMTGTVRSATSRSFNVIAIDLIDPGVRDPAPVDSPMAQAKRAAEAEARRRAAEAAALKEGRDPDEPDAKTPLVVDVRVAQASEYSRVVLTWPRPVPHRLDRDGESVAIVFDNPAVVDLTRLRLDPPVGMAGVAGDSDDQSFTLAFQLADGAEPRVWADGRTVTLDLVQPAGAPDRLAQLLDEEGAAAPARAALAPAAETAASMAATPLAAIQTPSTPARAMGPVRAEVTPFGGALQVAFAFDEPVGAAAFRRADALWIVFDARAAVNVRELARGGGRHVSSAMALSGADYAAVRLEAPPTTQIAATQEGDVWTFVLGEAIPNPPTPIAVARDADGAGPARLRLGLKNATAVRAVEDPEAGDVLHVATAMGPAQGLPAPRHFVGAAALASAHGVALRLTMDGVVAQLDGEAVAVGRPGGLLITPVRAGASGRALAQTPALPGLIDFDAWGGPEADFLDTHDRLARTAALSGTPSEDRMELAKFLLGHGMGFEAHGVLQRIAQDDPIYLQNPKFRALRGGSSVLMQRYEDAAGDFATPTLARDPAAALWRAHLAARERDWRETRREFLNGRDALAFFSAPWRARFLGDEAKAALALNDLGGARVAIDQALAEDAPKEVRQALMLTKAEFFRKAGDPDGARAMAEAVARSGVERMEAKALHELIRLDLALGEANADEAIERLETLRYRWRGDETEFDMIGDLGEAYVDKGDMRRGLGLMRAAVKRFPEHPAARDLSITMADIFRRLFLEGDADRMDPIEALALWYEFADLTPIGSDGDFMIRRLSDRLAEFDLLEQAATLLQHQVDNRLRGAAKAQVATDLAAIYLMDRRPELALRAIRSTRIARLPDAVNAERRLLEARALAEMGRVDHAMELLASEQSGPARRLKAEIAWKGEDWANAGKYYEAAAGESFRAPGPLSRQDETHVLRAALAYAMADDEARLRQLDDKFGAKMRMGAQSATWTVITPDGPVDGLRVSHLAKSIASTDTLDAFVNDFRARRSAEANAAGEDARSAREADAGPDGGLSP